jgi:hypothetical protein
MPDERGPISQEDPEAEAELDRLHQDAGRCKDKFDKLIENISKIVTQRFR